MRKIVNIFTVICFLTMSLFTGLAMCQEITAIDEDRYEVTVPATKVPHSFKADQERIYYLKKSITQLTEQEEHYAALIIEAQKELNELETKIESAKNSVKSLRALKPVGVNWDRENLITP